MRHAIRILAVAVAGTILAATVAFSPTGSTLQSKAETSTLIHLGGYHGDPANDSTVNTAVDRSRRLRLVQLTGPVLDGWRSRLEDLGFQVLAYVPHNTYLVWAEAPTMIDAVDRLDERTQDQIERVARCHYATTLCQGDRRMAVDRKAHAGQRDIDRPGSETRIAAATDRHVHIVAIAWYQTAFPSHDYAV